MWIETTPRTPLMRMMGGVLGAVLLCLSPVSSAQDTTLRVDGLSVTRVEVHGSVEVEISAAPDMSLLVRGPEEQMSPQPFEVREELLVLGYNRDARGQSFSRVRYKLALPQLERLRIAGSADVYLEPREEQKLLLVLDGAGDLRVHELSVSDELDIRVNGSGDITALSVRCDELDGVVSGSGDIRMDSLDAREIELGVRGSGDIKVRGGARAEKAAVAVVGSGDVDLRELDVQQVEASIVGSGDVRVGVVEELEVSILGSGDVHYAGDPEKNVTVLGAGSLNHRDR